MLHTGVRDHSYPHVHLLVVAGRLTPNRVAGPSPAQRHVPVLGVCLSVIVWTMMLGGRVGAGPEDEGEPDIFRKVWGVHLRYGAGYESY